MVDALCTGDTQQPTSNLTLKCPLRRVTAMPTTLKRNGVLCGKGLTCADGDGELRLASHGEPPMDVAPGRTCEQPAQAQRSQATKTYASHSGSSHSLDGLAGWQCTHGEVAGSQHSCAHAHGIAQRHTCILCR
jgi:hypothetical protein